jgi:hypothetical protein
MAWMSAWCASTSERRRASGGDAAGHSARASAAAAASATAAPASAAPGCSRAQRGSEGSKEGMGHVRHSDQFALRLTIGGDRILMKRKPSSAYFHLQTKAGQVSGEGE